jgi:hypothetical protein
MSHFAVAAQVMPQGPSHLMLQLDVSLHSMTLPVPTLNLHSASFKQVAVELAPALSSHFDDPLHVMELPSPPFPLHSASSPHVIDTAPVPLASHFVFAEQVTEQLGAHVAEQSFPGVQAHALPVQLQLAPVHVAAPASPPAVASGVRPAVHGRASSAVAAACR